MKNIAFLNQPLQLCLVTHVLCLVTHVLLTRQDPPNADYHPTEGLASIDVVHEWVTQQEFRIDVPYPFEVIDWSEGPAGWTGTITVVETAISESSGRTSLDQGGHTTQETETTQLTVRVTETTSEQAMSGVLASLKGTVEGRYSRLKTYAGFVTRSCGPVAGRRLSGTSRDRSTGSGAGDATITVHVFDDGTYLIAASADEFAMRVTGELQASGEGFGRGCVVEAKTETREHAPTERGMGGMIQAVGRVDPANPGVLSGSTTEESPGTGGTISKRVKTTTWEFRRQ